MHWQNVEWLLPSLPIKTCVYQCSVDLGRFVYRSTACSAMECLLWKKVAGADERAEKLELTEPHALDSVARCSRNHAHLG